jgi:formylglycine-generating enzyme required for sulfatase activity
MASPRATQRQEPAEAWRIMRWRSRHWAHREPLAEGVALTMLRIPAGSFEMGAPETEAESSDRERPVHRVTLGEFLLGQTPITQAQWREVAQWRPSKAGRAWNCPACDHTDSRVLEARAADRGGRFRRRRECLNCDFRFTTYEGWMLCPHCQNNDSRVLENRLADEDYTICRRRECLNCDFRFTTYEQQEEPNTPNFLDPNPSNYKGNQRPVEQVSWLDAIEFCLRLQQRTGRRYSLPSEAQWEYACRAGSTTPYHWGATISAELANYKGKIVHGQGEKVEEYRQQTMDVASFPANPWGLHDMHGNVWEWCADHWHDNYEGAPEDGRAWINEEVKENDYGVNYRLLRGGSWLSVPRDCRSACRSDNHPGSRNGGLGFRVCCLPQD